jgi:hypothetical protein
MLFPSLQRSRRSSQHAIQFDPTHQVWNSFWALNTTLTQLIDNARRALSQAGSRVSLDEAKVRRSYHYIPRSESVTMQNDGHFVDENSNSLQTIERSYERIANEVRKVMRDGRSPHQRIRIPLGPEFEGLNMMECQRRLQILLEHLITSCQPISRDRR